LKTPSVNAKDIARDAEKGGGHSQDCVRAERECSRAENRRSKDDIDYPWSRGGRRDAERTNSSSRKSPLISLISFSRKPSSLEIIPTGATESKYESGAITTLMQLAISCGVLTGFSFLGNTIRKSIVRDRYNF
jgi:hypothetical protein